MQDSNARLTLETIGCSFMLRSLSAQSPDSLCGSLEIWDLGSRWWIDGQGARLIHPPFSRLRRPLRERCKPELLGVGLVRI
jgi:hypothetical protein